MTRRPNYAAPIDARNASGRRREGDRGNEKLPRLSRTQDGWRVRAGCPTDNRAVVIIIRTPHNYIITSCCYILATI